MPGLIWQPVHAAIDERGASGDRLFWVVAPFVKLEALARLFETAKPAEGLKLVCRWLPSDLVSGTSDLEVFDYLSSRGCQLYVNGQVHMKLYVFESNRAMITSGNLTLRGLGYVESPNIEIGQWVDLSAPDWLKLHGVVRESRLITPEIYARFEAYVKASPPPSAAPTAPDLLGPARKYTLASLPATDSPEALAEFYFNRTGFQSMPEIARRGFQDLATYGISDSIESREAFDRALGDAFRKSPFVVDFVAHLRERGDLHFGAVNTWIHDKCEDVPLPYRWEIKPTTHAFYNWLARFVPGISWDRPNYSQVIYWERP